MIVKINGIRMGYEDTGHVGHPIVLIHGLGLDRSIWREVADTYLSRQRVIIPDVRGHGESEATEGVYSMTLLAEDIMKLLNFLNIEKAVICGHSMGGYITLAFAEKFPERLSGIGLITSRAEADSENQQAARYQMVEAVRAKGAVVLAESLSTKLTTDEEILMRTYEILSNMDPTGIIGVLQGMAERPDRRKLLPKIQVPTLVVAGDQDQIINVEDARQMAMALPNGKFHLVSGAGHMPMLEKPESLAKGLDWLVSQIE